MSSVPRRVVTGHTAQGASVVVSDGPVPVSREIPADGVAFHEIWNTTGAPAPLTAVEDDPTERELAVPPPERGTKIRINEFAPGHLDERGLQSPVHRTASVDYGIVLSGEITLILDDSEVTLAAGDVVVQRGTDHAWANRGTTTARVAFILVDGAFDQDLLDTLPSGAIDGLMHAGPRDAFLAEVARLSSAAPMALVNTHHHPDHTFGNWLMPAGTPVVAHQRCRAEVLAAGLEATRVVTGPDYGDVRLAPPDVTFTGSMTLHLDDVTIELHHVGPAHTSNDVVVWLPEQRCLFAGDVAFSGGQPFLLEGSVAGFSAALAAIRDLQPDVLVPGHGPVCRGAEVPALLDDLTVYVDFVAAVAAEGRADGLTPLATAERHRANPFAHWREPERLVGNLHRAFSELAGTALDTRLRVPEVWPDLVAFNGGPIECHA